MVILQRRVAGLSKESLDRFVLRARRAAGLRGIVNVLVTSSAEVRSLNRRFRGQDKATDVLSFPSSQPGRGKAKPKTAKRLVLEGDIAISVEVAARNAAPLRHSTAEEVKILTLHGMLHLAGFDHERDNGEMAHEEVRLRQFLRLPVSLIERLEPTETKSMKNKRNARTSRGQRRR